MRALALGCFYSHISTRTFRGALTASVDSCAEIKSATSVASLNLAEFGRRCWKAMLGVCLLPPPPPPHLPKALLASLLHELSHPPPPPPRHLQTTPQPSSTLPPFSHPNLLQWLTLAMYISAVVSFNTCDVTRAPLSPFHLLTQTDDFGGSGFRTALKI